MEQNCSSSSKPDESTPSPTVTPPKRFTPNENGVIDYDHHRAALSLDAIDDSLSQKFLTVTGTEPHTWMKRGLIFAHKGLDEFLSLYESGNKVFIYLELPLKEDPMNIGDVIMYIYIKWLQDTFKCALVVQIPDDEKASLTKYSFEQIKKFGYENVKNLAACGLTASNTFVFFNRSYRMRMKCYENIVSEMKMKVPLEVIQSQFGYDNDCPISLVDWPFYLASALISESYPQLFGESAGYCLIPHSINNSYKYTFAQEMSTVMGLRSPTMLVSQIVPPLTGISGDDVNVGADYTLLISDSDEILKGKIKKHSFSGSRGSGNLEDHKRLGGNPDVDISYQYLRYFEPSEDKLQEIYQSFSKGETSCGELKEYLITKISTQFNEINQIRNKITNDEVLAFFHE